MDRNLLLLFSLIAFLIGSKVEAFARPKKLFVLGDSYVDTGNYMKHEWGSWVQPYGSTFPGKPAGRFSDGRVLTDFIAEFLHLPSPVPYKLRKNKPKQWRHGMNFACGGSGVFNTNDKLPNMTTQIDAFEGLIKKGVYSRRDLESSLALVSVAGNDYTIYFANNGTIQGVPMFTRSLIGQLRVDLKRLRGLGVRKIAVTTMEPSGCLPTDTAELSFTKCNETSNMVPISHNQLLEGVVDQMNTASGDSTVVLLDMYSAFMYVLQGQDQQGNRKFEEPFKPCCMMTREGGGCGRVDEKGRKLYKVCHSPKSYFFWDRVHPSQAGWAAVTASLNTTLLTFKH